MNSTSDNAVWPIWDRPGFTAIPDPQQMTPAQVAEHRAMLNVPAFCQALAAMIESAPTVAAVCHNRTAEPLPMNKRNFG